MNEPLANVSFENTVKNQAKSFSPFTKMVINQQRTTEWIENDRKVVINNEQPLPDNLASEHLEKPSLNFFQNIRTGRKTPQYPHTVKNMKTSRPLSTGIFSALFAFTN